MRGNFLITLFIYFLVIVQGQFQNQIEDKGSKNKRITFNAKGIAFITYNEDIGSSPGNNKFDFNDETRLIGINVGVNYNILNGLSLGICTGREFFNQPEFAYYPIYIRAAMNGGTRKNSIHTEISFGGHITNESKSGVLARFYLGYRFRVIKTFFVDLSMVYTFQNLYQSFENSFRTGSYYNFESIGLSLGIDIN